MELQPWQLVLGALTLTVAAAGQVRSVLRDRLKDLIDQLGDSTDRQWWINQLSKSTPLAVRYLLTLLRLNAYVSRIYSTAFSVRAFDRSLVFTLVYPFSLYLLAWGFGGSNKIGSLVFLGSHANGTERLLVVLLYFALAGFAAFLIQSIPHSERIFVFDKRPIFKEFTALDWTKLGAIILLLSTTWWLNQKLTSVGYAVSFSVFFLLSISLYLAWRTLFSKQRPAAPILTGLLLIGLAITLAGVKLLGMGSGSLAFLVLFFAMLPLTNALFDYLSWAVTRWFLRLVAIEPVTRTRIPVILRGLAVDAGWAGVCLCALALTIIGTYALHGVFFPSQSVDWRGQIDALRHASSPTSVLIVGMLVTTLIPTAIHLLVGISGVFIAYYPGADRISKLLSSPNLTKRTMQEAAASIQWIRIGVFVLPTVLAIALCCLPFVVGPFLEGPVHASLKALLSSL